MLTLGISFYGLSFYFTLKIEQVLDNYISYQLNRCIPYTAGFFNIKFLDILLPGNENSYLYKWLYKKLKILTNVLNANSIVVLDKDLKVKVSYPIFYFIGQEYPIVETDPLELKKVLKGECTCSNIYYFKEKAYKTAYVPIKDKCGKTKYILCIEVGSSRKDIIKKFKKITLYSVLIGIILALFCSMILWLSLTYPLRKLTETMKLVTEKGYNIKRITSKRKDEIGFLIDTFNYMLDTLQEKEEELKKMYEKELKRKEHLALLGEFSAGIAHEIRNPLSALEGFTEILERKINDKYSQEIILKMREEIYGLNETVGKILSYAREPHLNIKEVSFFDFIQDVLLVSFYNKKYQEMNIEIKLLLDPNIVTIKVDPQEMKKALVNIIRNALESMEDSEKKILTIRTYKEKDTIVIDIEDTGEGISEKDLEKIFQPFYTTKESGTGLGLAIVSKIIEKHNGEIKVESKEGKGSKFFIILKN